MSGFNCQIDTRQLKELQRKLEKMRDNSDTFMDKCAKNISARLLRKVIKRTPVGNYSGQEYDCNGKDMQFHHKGYRVKNAVGGALRRGWTVNTEEEAAPKKSKKAVSVDKYLNQIQVERSGNTTSITIDNPVSYAPYVEYGHRIVIKDGSGKKKTVGYAPGHHMLEMSVQDIQKVAPKVLEKMVKEYFGKGMQ